MKKVLRGSGEERDRKEDDADREGRGEGRDGDLPRSDEDRDSQLLSHPSIAMDVFDLDRRVVDEHPDREGEAAERHDVERLAGEEEPDHADEDRDRDRRRDDEHAPPAPEEHEHHERDEPGGDERFAEDAVDGPADEDRLIHVHLEPQPAGRGRLDRGRDVLRRIDDRQGRGAFLAEDGEVRRALAVHADHVGLDREPVVDVRDVPDEDRRAADDLERDRVEVGGRRRAPVEEDVVVAAPDPRAPGGEDDVVLLDGVHDVGGGESLGGELREIEVDVHLARGAAVRRGGREAGDGEELHPHEVQAVVVELLLRHRVALHRELGDRDVRSVELEDDGRLNPGRHAPARRERDG